jgi:hypothetical protein
MGLRKAIEHRKENRRPWPYYKLVDNWCRNHGRCDYCYGNRTYGRRKTRAAMNANVVEAESEGILNLATRD